MTVIVVLVVLAVLVFVNLVVSFFVLINLPDPSSQEVDRLRRELTLADEHLSTVTRRGAQTMLNQMMSDLGRIELPER